MVLSSLIQSESGGNWRAQNAVPGSGGVGHFGRLQFSRGRLQDAARAGIIPDGVTPEQFMADPAMQQRVEQWHFGDIDRFIDRNNLAQFEGQTINGVPVTRSGMHAVAHLGGSGGLQRFLESGGQYNPADAYGTSLLDYLGRHGGQDMATRQDTQRPGGILAALTGPAQQGRSPQQAQRGSIWDNAPLGLSDPDRRARLAMAFEGMTLNPNTQLMAALQGDIEGRREDARTAQARNATAEWLRANGREDLAGVVEAGGLQGAQAMGLAMEAMQAQRASGASEAQRNATAQWLASQGREDLAGAVASGALTGAQAFEMFNAEPDLTATQREYNQAVAEGFQGTLMDYRRQLAEAGRSQTNVSVGAEETAFSREAGQRAAQRLDAALVAGQQAARGLQTLSALEQRLQNAPTGAGASLQLLAGNFGIQSEGLSDLQAAQALLNQMIPQQRPPGSGTMSDMDLRMYEASLPRIINSPNGNRLIIDSMRNIMEYDIRAAEIAQQAFNGEISPQEASSQIMRLGDPLADVRSLMGVGSAPETPSNRIQIQPDDADLIRRYLEPQQ